MHGRSRIELNWAVLSSSSFHSNFSAQGYCPCCIRHWELHSLPSMKKRRKLIFGFQTMLVLTQGKPNQFPMQLVRGESVMLAVRQVVKPQLGDYISPEYIYASDRNEPHQAAYHRKGWNGT